jgi:hypothetical protein
MKLNMPLVSSPVTRARYFTSTGMRWQRTLRVTEVADVTAPVGVLRLAVVVQLEEVPALDAHAEVVAAYAPRAARGGVGGVRWRSA